MAFFSTLRFFIIPRLEEKESCDQNTISAHLFLSLLIPHSKWLLYGVLTSWFLQELRLMVDRGSGKDSMLFRSDSHPFSISRPTLKYPQVVLWGCSCAGPYLNLAGYIPGFFLEFSYDLPLTGELFRSSGNMYLKYRIWSFE